MDNMKSEQSLPRNFHWPRIQVAGVSELEEAIFCMDVGIVALGFTLELPSGVHDGLTSEKARRIIADLPERAFAVLITYLSEADKASDLALYIGAKAIQFHGGIKEAELERFRNACPEVKTIGCVNVTGPDSIGAALLFKPPLWDAVILDTMDPGSGRRGATGLTHDWTISAQIVERSSVPVILAGGLNAKNVAEAIIKVKPHAVDSHTGLEDPDGTRCFAKIRAFAEEATRAFAT
jgi:phosphoribosylanthranilate isomerase